MAQILIDETMLKKLLKEAVLEALDERRDLLNEVFAEALEAFALSETAHERHAPGTHDGYDDYFRILEGEA